MCHGLSKFDIWIHNFLAIHFANWKTETWTCMYILFFIDLKNKNENIISLIIRTAILNERNAHATVFEIDYSLQNIF